MPYVLDHKRLAKGREILTEMVSRFDASEEFPDPQWDDDDDGDDEEDEDYSYGEKALLSAVGDATIEEIKAAGLGYVDTDSDPSPKPGAARLRRYWTKGPGAAKILWGTDGDFSRCVKQLRKYVGAGAEGLCNVYHRTATGHAPGQGPHAGGKSVMVADTETKGLHVEETGFRLENLFLSKQLFENWERVTDALGYSYDVGYNVLTKAWEAHDATNFGTVICAAPDEEAVYRDLNDYLGEEA